MRPTRIASLAGFAFALAAIPGDARAQRRMVFDETIIQGKVQKPEITIFISRQNLNTGYSLELRESFVPKIVDTVKQKPF